MKKLMLIFFVLFASHALWAQLPFPLPGGDTKKEESSKDRLDSLLSLLNKKKYKTRPYESVITRDAVAYNGLFSVYAVRDSFFIEIPDTLLGRDMVMITRVVKGSVSSSDALGGSKYPGESLDEKNVYFKTAPDSAINLLSDLQADQAEPGSRIAGAVANANTDPIVQTFQIVALGKNKSSILVDATAFLKIPGQLTNIGKATATAIHVEYVHAYPINVEIGIYRTSSGAPVVTNTSFVVLPRVPMQQRLYDRRVGYFADDVFYFSDEQHQVEKREFINRWRLEPKPEDRERWQRGELVEPANPIVIYIDPHTPKQWVKYLIMGINDWQQAFEQAGFKNAIMGKEWPYGDSANLDDARYSFVCYLPSDVINAYGPNVHDLRSGEIIQTHIGWYHNVMTLLHDWYLVQAGATDPRARHAKFDDELMGQLIRFVSSHEVGHTLGLRHNFGSSSMTPVEKLRDKEWLKQHGHTASIMDYARFNYVAQPEDNIPEECLWPHIGEYDRWAIEWGYKYSGAQTVEEDKKITRQWISQRLAANPRLWFGSQEGEKKEAGARPDDPRCQTEDLGDNNMTAGTYGINNLKRILPNLPAWCKEEGGLYDNLGEAYKALTGQFKRYVGHVLTNIGGVERTYQSEDSGGDVYAPVARAKQKQALAFLNNQLFTTPYWLLDPTVTRKVTNPLEANFVIDLQDRVMNTLLDSAMFAKLAANTARFGTAASYPTEEFLSDIHHDILGGLPTGKPMDLYRRNLQKTYIGALADILSSLDPGVTETEAYGLVRADLQRAQNEMTAHLQQYSGLDKAHLESQIAVIKKVLNPKQD
ncbi:zinc-dependent metalloprotease [Dinghuibacter silviterrae]|uniref:Uncharacterized protein DUF5118 n=1 Tax=Dinghuibacter silviterrae TaxID=1539049 RepID=A0A4R8DFB0_9BACT|nr:zinc-dependent metalloprotease [Dinghuibacter silviterrae]TDW96269.1 uncharacterized protein DUF5118 [Dinghuibacter silviterrae]